MFNDKYGLTEAVLQGRKTMTRRFVGNRMTDDDIKAYLKGYTELANKCAPYKAGEIRNLSNFDPRQDWMEWGIDDKGKANIGIFHNETYKHSIYPQHQPGEVVAVAQSYKDLGYTKQWVEQHISPNPNAKPTDPFEKKYPGWNNKMFVRADLMPHQIRITDIKVERMQDISDEDIMKEGITYIAGGGYGVRFGGNYNVFALNPIVAFAALIDKVSGKGTWEGNPYVFAYSFELCK